MGITCHWVDEDWSLQKRLIAFRGFDERHTADNIYRLINTILDEYNLTIKISSISFDNASANTASIPDLKRVCKPILRGHFFHIRCFCHILNLCVQDGIKLVDDLNPIKTAISFLWFHPNTLKNWKKFCKQNGMPPKSFPKDVPTRWNSTYELLVESYPYRILLCNFITAHVNQVTLYPGQWDVCKKLIEILKVFYDSTQVLSGVYYPTSHLLLTHAINIVAVLFDYEDDHDISLFEAINAMKEKWLTYFKKIPKLNLIATVLDPRLKIDGLRDLLNVYYDTIKISCDVSKIVKKVNDILNKMYIEYCQIYKDIAPIQRTESSTQQSKTNKGKGLMMILERIKRPRGSSSGSSTGNLDEIENYLTTSFEFSEQDAGLEQHFDILRWWKQKSNQFPILSRMAKDILASPVSTVSVEQAFSAGGQILDETRSSMLPSNVEAQSCLDDWTKAMYRQQEFIVEPNEEDDEGTTGTGDSED